MRSYELAWVTLSGHLRREVTLLGGVKMGVCACVCVCEINFVQLDC